MKQLQAFKSRCMNFEINNGRQGPVLAKIEKNLYVYFTFQAA